MTAIRVVICERTDSLLVIGSFILGAVYSAERSAAGEDLATDRGHIVHRPPGSLPLFDAFQPGLRELGYMEGKNVLIERRYAEGRLDRMPALVNELVQQKVDVIRSA